MCVRETTAEQDGGRDGSEDGHQWIDVVPPQPLFSCFFFSPPCGGCWVCCCLLLLLLLEAYLREPCRTARQDKVQCVQESLRALSCRVLLTLTHLSAGVISGTGPGQRSAGTVSAGLDQMRPTLRLPSSKAQGKLAASSRRCACGKTCNWGGFVGEVWA